MEDKRHLWPVFFGLIRDCRPALVLGEQVASAAVIGKVGCRAEGESAPVWLDGVFGDLEGAGYTCGAAVMGAFSVGAPHIRQRLYWAAHDASERWDLGPGVQREDGRAVAEAGGDDRERERAGNRPVVWLVHAKQSGLEGYSGHERDGHKSGWIVAESPGSATQAGDVGFWSRCSLVECRDGTIRRVPAEPALFPLAPRLPGRVGLLLGSGNAIVPQVAAEFIEAVEECIA